MCCNTLSYLNKYLHDPVRNRCTHAHIIISNVFFILQSTVQTHTISSALQLSVSCSTYVAADKQVSQSVCMFCVDTRVACVRVALNDPPSSIDREHNSLSGTKRMHTCETHTRTMYPKRDNRLETLFMTCLYR